MKLLLFILGAVYGCINTCDSPYVQNTECDCTLSQPVDAPCKTGY